MFNNADVVKVHEFLKLSRNVTRSEISGGTGLSPELVQTVLDAVVAANEVTVDGSANTARYNLAGASTVPVVETPASWRSADQIWSDGERARVLAEEKAKQPKPEPRHVITDADIVLPPKPKPLTPEERKEYEISHRNRRSIVNPNAFIVK